MSSLQIYPRSSWEIWDGGGGEGLQRASGQILKDDVNGVKFKDEVNGFHPPRIFYSLGEPTSDDK